MRQPNDTQRLLIAGKTGSGKTMEGLHHLSARSFDEMPWLVYDFKGNDLVSRIPVTALLGLGDEPPDDPGIYVVPVRWEDAAGDGMLSRQLYGVLEHGRIGVFIDEGPMLGQHNAGLRSVLTRGRSAGVPVIFLAQRPAHIETFALSEAEYLQIFLLVFPEDRERIWKYVPQDRLDFDRLRQAGEFHSYWYDVVTDRLELVPPCPPFQEIYDHMLARLPVYVDEQDGQAPGRVRI